MIEYIFAALALDTLGNIYDAVKTEQGLKKGLSREGSTLIDKLFGTTKPSAVELYTYGFVKAALFTGLALLGYYKGTQNIPYIAIGGGIAALIADGLKHVQGGLQWNYLLKGGVLDVDGFPVINGKQQLRSAFEKFIGPWVW